jgi:hypothetical protein
VAYLVFGVRPRPQCGLGVELVLLIPLLARLRGNPPWQVSSRRRTQGRRQLRLRS